MTVDVLIIGGGVNGLTTAAYLARAGRRVLVVEARTSLGGLCGTESFADGFLANTCVDDAGWVPPVVAQDLGLAAHGYAPVFATTSLTIPVPGGAPLLVTPDIRATADALRPYSARDAERWPAFCEFIARLTGFLEALYSVRAPAVESNAPKDLLALASLGGRLRGLGRRGIIDLLRTVPMPMADVLDEWFEFEPLRAALATLAVQNVELGPQSGGTALVFLHRHVGLPAGHIGARRVAPGGVGTLVSALAKAVARAGGAERTGTEVKRVRVRDDRVTGVTLATGEDIDATVVVSSADPRRTFATMLDAGDFDPEFLHGIDHVRMRGPQVRMHFALAGVPAFATEGTPWSAAATRGTIVVAPNMHYVERSYDAAKHGRAASQPWLHVTLPSLDDRTFAPAGHQVMTVHAQCAAHRLAGGWTPDARAAFAASALQLLEAHAPGVSALVRQQEILAPPDIEARYGATEGSLLHGELALDQFLFTRPVPTAARYGTPLEGLWFCGSGAHPGAGTAGATARLAAKEILARKRP